MTAATLVRTDAGAMLRPSARGFDFLSDLQALFLPPSPSGRLTSIPGFIHGRPISSPACESRDKCQATRGLLRGATIRSLLANAGGAPKSRSPAANHNINFLLRI